MLIEVAVMNLIGCIRILDKRMRMLEGDGFVRANPALAEARESVEKGIRVVSEAVIQGPLEVTPSFDDPSPSA